MEELHSIIFFYKDFNLLIRVQMEVNPHNLYAQVIDKYHKNLCNPICSCMDWITVSIRFLQNSPELSENIDVRVM